eukprot:3777772-Prymnesium_polylepis.2
MPAWWAGWRAGSAGKAHGTGQERAERAVPAARGRSHGLDGWFVGSLSLGLVGVGARARRFACRGHVMRTVSGARARCANVVRKGGVRAADRVVVASWRLGVRVGPLRCRGRARWRRARVRIYAFLTCVGATWTLF